MADRQGKSMLRRKVEAARTSPAAARQLTPCKALSQAFVKAADRRLGLAASVTSCSAGTATLAELLETLPESGLLAVLEGPGEAQGLAVLDSALLSAVIEMLMTGRLAAHPARPRRPTRTDAALCADLIDDMLRGFEAPFLGAPVARWAAGFGYSTFLDDPRPLGLMLEEVDYRTVSLSAELGGARRAGLVLALPADGRGGRAVSPAGGDARAEPEADAVDSWAEALETQVMRGSVTLTAILHRLRLPIAAVAALAPGQELAIPRAALDGAALVGPDGVPVVQGRLGQSGGKRALRLAAEAGTATAADTPGEAQAAPRPPASAPSPSPASNPASTPSSAPPAAAGVPPAAPDDPLAGLPDLADGVGSPMPDMAGLPALTDPADR